MLGSACLDDDTLAQFVAGQLAAGELGRVDQHLADCSDCCWLVALSAPEAEQGAAQPELPAANEDRFEILERIGEGAMGVVHRAYDRHTGATVAVKRLKPSAALQSRDVVKRFLREIAILQRLAHPNIVRIVALSHGGDVPAIVMEYVEGGSLRASLRAQGALTTQRVVAILLELSDALARAHHLGVVHRDLKPENVLLAADGSPRLADFGLARFCEGRSTSDGILVGTLPYVSPEALDGAPFEAKADLWALGVMAFEMLAGQRPFQGETPAALMRQILHGHRGGLELLRADVPAPLVELTKALLVRNPRLRPTAREVGAALEALRPVAGRAPPVQALTLGPTERWEVRHAEGLESWEALPRATTPFIGRQTELGALCGLLEDSQVRLITLWGPGGAGKSRLAIEAARRLAGAGGARDLDLFARGVFFVDLTLIDAPELLPSAVANALSFVLRPGVGPSEQLCAFLREKAVLLILDNFEHVLPAAEFVHRLLQVAPGVKVLATSREPLNLSAETRFALGGLALPESDASGAAEEPSALQLFVSQARRVRADFELREDPASVVKICRLVEGMPLGIVLAASWVRLLSSREIVEEISRSLEFLQWQLRDLPGRQRSLRAVFEHSWTLLGEPERELCARLSLFRGGFDRDAAAGICDARLDHLAALVDKSLLVADPASGRYHVHELVRQFAESKLNASPGAREATVQRFARYFAQLLKRLEPDLCGRDQSRAMRTLATELGNVRAAWQILAETRDLEAAEAAAHALVLYHHRRGARAEAAEQMAALERAFTPRADQGDERARRLVGLALSMQGGLAENQGQRREGSELLDRALAALSGTGDSREKALALILSGGMLLTKRDAETAVREAEAGMVMFRALGSPWYLPQGLTWMARVYYETAKDLDAAERCLRESLEVQRAHNSGELVLPGSLNGLALVRGALGDWRGASELLQQALVISERARDDWAVEEALRLMAWVRASVGDYEQAVAAARRCVEVCRETGARESIVWCDFIFGDAEIEQGHLEEAVAEFEAGRQLTRPGTLQRAVADMKLADVAVRRGRLREADATLRAALAIAERSPTEWPIRAALSALGHVACEERRYTEAQAHWTRALERCLSSHRSPALLGSLADFATLYARTGDPERSLELLGALGDHPAMHHQTRRWRVAPLLAELAQSLPRARFDAALARGQGRDLLECARECLAACTKPGS